MAEKKWTPFGGESTSGLVAVGGGEVFLRDAIGHLRGDVDVVRCGAGAALAHCNPSVMETLMGELRLRLSFRTVALAFYLVLLFYGLGAQRAHLSLPTGSAVAAAASADAFYEL